MIKVYAINVMNILILIRKLVLNVLLMKLDALQPNISMFKRVNVFSVLEDKFKIRKISKSV